MTTSNFLSTKVLFLSLFLNGLRPTMSNGQNTPITIVGRIYGEVNGEMHLFFDGNFQDRNKTSAKITNGRFIFKENAKLPILARITMGEDSYVVDVFIDKPSTFVTLTSTIRGTDPHAMNELRLSKVVGSDLEDKRTKFSREAEAIQSAAANSTVKDSMFLSLLSKFIIRNKTSLLSPYLISKEEEIGTQKIEGLLSQLDTSLRSTYEYSVAESLLKRLTQQQSASSEMFGKVLVSTSNGNLATPKTFFKKITFITFWASWCGPCRIEHPALNAIYKKYQTLNFQLIGISLDTDVGKWHEAIKADSLVWPQLQDSLGFNGQLAKYYALDRIPKSFLIDDLGNILAKDITTEELISKLQLLYLK